MCKQKAFSGRLGLISKGKLLASLNGLLVFLALVANPIYAADLIADKRVGAGYSSSFFIDPAGNVWAWGGREGREPKQVLTDAHSISIDKGSFTVFVIRKDGSLWGWGNSGYGQLGVISKDRLKEPIQILPRVRSVVAMSDTVFAIKPDGSLWAWGFLGLNRGDNIKKELSRPRKVLDKVKLVSTSSTHTLALREDGSLWSWGYNQCGGLGDGTWKEGYRPRKVNLKNLQGRKIISIANNNGESFAVTEDGLVWVWGENHFTRPGCVEESIKIPTRLVELDNVQDIVAGWSQVLALKKDGTVWGTGGYIVEEGKVLPSDTKYQSLIPRGEYVQVLSNAQEIAVGENHALVLKKDGTLWAWGENGQGQLGDGTTKNRADPRQVLFPK